MSKTETVLTWNRGFTVENDEKRTKKIKKMSNNVENFNFRNVEISTRSKHRHQTVQRVL